MNRRVGVVRASKRRELRNLLPAFLPELLTMSGEGRGEGRFCGAGAHWIRGDTGTNHMSSVEQGLETATL